MDTRQTRSRPVRIADPGRGLTTDEGRELERELTSWASRRHVAPAPARLTSSELDEARLWLLECADAGVWADEPEQLEHEIGTLAPAQLERAVDRYYAGGLVAFMAAGAAQLSERTRGFEAGR